jgi:hypothetical protein
MTGSFTASEAGVLQQASWANTRRYTRDMVVEAFSPGNPSVSFFIPTTGMVTLEVFDLLGHKVATPVNQIKAAGIYTVMLKSGIRAHGYYFVKLGGEGTEIVKTLRVVK